MKKLLTWYATRTPFLFVILNVQKPIDSCATKKQNILATPGTTGIDWTCVEAFS